MADVAVLEQGRCKYTAPLFMRHLSILSYHGSKSFLCFNACKVNCKSSTMLHATRCSTWSLVFFPNLFFCLKVFLEQYPQHGTFLLMATSFNYFSFCSWEIMFCLSVWHRRWLKLLHYPWATAIVAMGKKQVRGTNQSGRENKTLCC